MEHVLFKLVLKNVCVSSEVNTKFSFNIYSFIWTYVTITIWKQLGPEWPTGQLSTGKSFLSRHSFHEGETLLIITQILADLHTAGCTECPRLWNILGLGKKIFFKFVKVITIIYRTEGKPHPGLEARGSQTRVYWGEPTPRQKHNYAHIKTNTGGSGWRKHPASKGECVQGGASLKFCINLV